MDSFHYSVLGIALVMLIIMFIIVGVMLSRNKVSIIYPPYANDCPNYWSMNSEGKCVLTEGGINLPTISPLDANLPGKSNGSIDFKNQGWGTYSGATSAICAKKKWALDNGVLWDGVSNYNGTCT
jgi:hypothetical protein